MIEQILFNKKQVGQKAVCPKAPAHQNEPFFPTTDGNRRKVGNQAE
jgi:hypothetical protein